MNKMLRWTRQTFLSLWSVNIFLIEMFTKMALPVVECSPRKECGHPQKKVNSASSNDNRSGRYSKNRFWKNAALWICMNCCVIKRRNFEYLKDKDLEQRDVLIFAQYFFGLGKITSWRRDNVYEELFKIQSTFHTLCARMLNHFSCVWLTVMLWTLICQAPLSMGLSRQEHWSGLQCPPPGGLPDPRDEPLSLTPPALASRFFVMSTGSHILAG